MQATLLGVGIAIILALVAALVGPHFVDWTQYRPYFEAEATRLVGAPVRIAGPIDLRILPTPSLKLSQIEIGAARAPQLAARELHMEAALGSLVRGEMRAAELRIVGPDVRLGLAEDGRVAWQSAAIGFSPERLTIERVAIEDGRAFFRDAASGMEIELERFWFTGELRSLIGPIKGEGGFTSAGERYGYRISGSRVGDDGTMKVRLGLDPGDRPLVIEADGLVSLDAKAPRFEGTFTLARPAGIALPSGRGMANTPWRATSRLTATPKRALLEEIDYQYGPDERAFKLGGTAEIQFGRFPRAEGILTARQVDLDHTLTLPEAKRNLPLAAVKSLIEPFGSTYRPNIPVKLGIGVDTVTLAGGTLLAVRGDIKTAGDGWDLETFEFRAPGFAQVRMSGHVALAGSNVTFTGPMQIEATDPKAFVAWLDGRSGAAPILAGPLKAGGTMTIGAQEIAVDRLKVEVDRKTIEGRLGYAWASAGRPPRLDAELKAAELDVDALLGFARNALAGSGFEWPGEIGLALEVNRATVAGYDAKGVSAKLKLDRNGLAIDRARIADLGQASFDLNGRVDGPLASPRGSLTLDIDGRNLDAAVEVLAKFAPQAGERLRQTASRIVPLRLRMTLQVEEAQAGAAGPSTARLTLAGSAKGARVRLAADATGDAATRTVPALRLDGEVAHDDGGALVALLGLDQMVAVERKPGSFRFTARGPAHGDMAVDARLAATGLDATANGTMRFAENTTAKLDLTWRAADASPLARSYAPATVGPLPVGLRMRVAATASDVTLDDLSGTVADTPLRGKLTLSRDGSRLDGQLDLDTLDASALVAVMAGAPRPAARRDTWSPEPFGEGLFGKVQGRLGFRVGKSALWPLSSVRQLSGTLRLAPGEIALEDLKGAVDEGRLAGELTLLRRDGLEARGRVELTDVGAATLLPEGGRSAVTGRGSLQVRLEGNGLSPAALVGSLRGSGTLTAADAELAGLNPKAFESVMQAVDRGLTIDSVRLRDVVTTLLDGGRLGVPRIDAAFTINGGYVRLGNTIVKGRGADLMMSGNANLNDGSVEARFVLSGAQSTESAVRPDVFVTLKGPAQAPKRTVDVAALSGWLMLRSIERQAKQLEAIEAERREGTGVGSIPPAQAAAPNPAATDAAPETRDKPRPVIRTPRATPPAAPSAAAPAPTMPLGTERAPTLPPPLEIGPAPGRRSRANGGELPQNTGPRPPGFVPPAAYSRPFPLDPLVNPHR